MVIVPVEMTREPPPHLHNIIETVGVEQLFVEVGVEALELAVPFFELGGDLVHAELRQ